MKKAFLLSVALAVTGCSTQTQMPLLISGETVLIRGNISEKTAIEFKDALSKRRISRVLVATGGGLVEPSIEIAREIHDRGLEVEVVGDCFSSCANYIFPAGKTKVISGLGVVAWHGNINHLLYLHESGKKPLENDDLNLIKRLLKLEQEFFTSIGLDEFICWFGKIDPYNVRNMYFLDASDMSRFGLQNVSVRSGYASTDVDLYNPDGVENLRYLKVDWNSFKKSKVQP